MIKVALLLTLIFSLHSNAADSFYDPRAGAVCEEIAKRSLTVGVHRLCLNEIKGHFFDQARVASCEVMASFSSQDALQCLKIIRGASFNPHAATVCSNMMRMTSYGANECLKEIKNTDFDYNALGVCAEMARISPSEATRCLSYIKNDFGLNYNQAELCTELARQADTTAAIACLMTSSRNNVYEEQALLACRKTGSYYISCLDFAKNRKFNTQRLSKCDSILDTNITGAIYEFFSGKLKSQYYSCVKSANI